MATAIVLLIVLVLASLALRSIWKNRKNGGCCGCQGGCPSCRGCSQRDK